MTEEKHIFPRGTIARNNRTDEKYPLQSDTIAVKDDKVGKRWRLNNTSGDYVFVSDQVPEKIPEIELGKAKTFISALSRMPLEMLIEQEARYQAPVKKIEEYKGVKYIVDKDNYVWVQESPYPKLDKHYTYLSEFKKHVDTLEKRKQDEMTMVQPKSDKIITETFPTLREAEQRRFDLQYTGYLIKDEVAVDTSEFGKSKFSISYIPEAKPAYAGFKEIMEKEKPKFVIENPLNVDLSKSVVPYPELQKPKEPLQLRNRVDGIELVVGTKTYLVRHLEAKGFIETTDYYTRLYHQPYNATVPSFHQDYDRILNYFIKNNFVPVKPLPIVPDTTSADYKAGYNLGIQGRIAPAVPSWQDQGQVDHTAGYAEGKKVFETKNKENIIVLPREGDTQSYPYAAKVVGVPENKAWTEVQPIFDDTKKIKVLTSRIRELTQEDDRPIFGQPIKKQHVTFDAPVFGQPIKPEKSEPVFFGDTRQRATEQEQKKRASEGKRLRNQQTLTSAVSTSHRLTEFEIKEKPVMLPERIKSLPFKKPIPFVTPGRYPPKRIITPARRLYAMKPEDKQEARQKMETSVFTRLNLIAEKTRLKQELEQLKKGE